MNASQRNVEKAYMQRKSRHGRLQNLLGGLVLMNFWIALNEMSAPVLYIIVKELWETMMNLMI